jgi:translation elongation factor EF-1beta
LDATETISSMNKSKYDLTIKNVSIKIHASSSEDAFVASILFLACISMYTTLVYITIRLIVTKKKKNQKEELGSGLYYEAFYILEEDKVIFEAKLSKVLSTIRSVIYQDISALKHIVDGALEAKLEVEKTKVVTKGVEKIAGANAVISTNIEEKWSGNGFKIGQLELGFGIKRHHAAILVIKADPESGHAQKIVKDINNHASAQTVVDSIEVLAPNSVNELKKESIKSAKKRGRQDQVKKAIQMESETY